PDHGRERRWCGGVRRLTMSAAFLPRAVRHASQLSLITARADTWGTCGTKSAQVGEVCGSGQTVALHALENTENLLQALRFRPAGSTSDVDKAAFSFSSFSPGVS
ncbi:hypothetical protein BaRGS_00020289, partial [Batillaria attramentaria]